MILSRDQLDDLRELAGIWPASMVLIGAAALGFSHGLWWRSTSDLDLVLTIELAELAIPLPAGWQRTRLPQRIVGPRGTRFDLVPATPALRAARSVTWNDGVVMNLTGVELAFAHAVTHELHGHLLAIAPPPVIAILKMVAYLDRPPERQRDLKDLAHLLEEYVGPDDDRRFDEGLGLDLDFELVPAYLLGKDVGRLVHDDAHLVATIERFLVVAEGIASEDLRRAGPRLACR